MSGVALAGQGRVGGSDQLASAWVLLSLRRFNSLQSLLYKLVLMHQCKHLGDNPQQRLLDSNLSDLYFNFLATLLHKDCVLVCTT